LDESFEFTPILSSPFYFVLFGHRRGPGVLQKQSLGPAGVSAERDLVVGLLVMLMLDLLVGLLVGGKAKCRQDKTLEEVVDGWLDIWGVGHGLMPVTE
jgi:hypothetical protein